MTEDTIIGQRWIDPNAEALYNQLLGEVRRIERHLRQQFERESGPIIETMTLLANKYQRPYVILPADHNMAEIAKRIGQSWSTEQPK